MARFLDTNILLQHLARENEQKAIGCRELLLRLERGEEVAVATDIVIFETVYILQSVRHYGLPRNPHPSVVGTHNRTSRFSLAS